MEIEQYIENILNSTNGMTAVIPSDNLFSKIQKRIRQESKVSPKILWLVAASIALLIMLNFAALAFKSKEKTSTTTAYLEMTVNKSNQLYQ